MTSLIDSIAQQTRGAGTVLLNHQQTQNTRLLRKLRLSFADTCEDCIDFLQHCVGVAEDYGLLCQSYEREEERQILAFARDVARVLVTLRQETERLKERQASLSLLSNTYTAGHSWHYAAARNCLCIPIIKSRKNHLNTGHNPHDQKGGLLELQAALKTTETLLSEFASFLDQESKALLVKNFFPSEGTTATQEKWTTLGDRCRRAISSISATSDAIRASVACADHPPGKPRSMGARTCWSLRKGHDLQMIWPGKAWGGVSRCLRRRLHDVFVNQTFP